MAAASAQDRFLGAWPTMRSSMALQRPAHTTAHTRPQQTLGTMSLIDTAAGQGMTHRPRPPPSTVGVCPTSANSRTHTRTTNPGNPRARGDVSRTPTQRWFRFGSGHQQTTLDPQPARGTRRAGHDIERHGARQQSKCMGTTHLEQGDCRPHCLHHTRTVVSKDLWLRQGPCARGGGHTDRQRQRRRGR